MIADLAMQHALDRYHELGANALNEPDKTLATVWCFESKVANGGFEHFFRSLEGELAEHAPTAFRTIEAETLARIAEQANSVFGPVGVPADRATREQALAALPAATKHVFDDLESQYFEYSKDLDARLEQYAVRATPAAH